MRAAASEDERGQRVIAATERFEVHQTTPPGGGRAVLSVARWELQRLVARHLTWALAAGAALFFGALLLVKHSWVIQQAGAPSAPGALTIVGSSPLGLLYEVTFAVLLLFGMCLPFVAADGVAHDYQERVHELLMTTPTPGWAYVVGRYLAVLLLGTVLSAETLIAVLVADEVLSRTAASYPPPAVGTLLTVWALVVLPAAVVLLSLSFALGTCWPRLASVVKLVVLLAWIGMFVSGRGGNQPAWLQSWFPTWDPTSNSLAAAGQALALRQYAQLAAGGVGRNAAALRAQSQLPALQPWVLPHLGLVALGLACAALVAVGFQRFRTVLE